jgi:hypothetical protein
MFHDRLASGGNSIEVSHSTVGGFLETGVALEIRVAVIVGVPYLLTSAGLYKRFSHCFVVRALVDKSYPGTRTYASSWMPLVFAKFPRRSIQVSVRTVPFLKSKNFPSVLETSSSRIMAARSSRIGNRRTT